MRLPRDLSGEVLAKALGGIEICCRSSNRKPHSLNDQARGEHHITIPNHSPIKVGTLSAILRDIEDHLN